MRSELYSHLPAMSGVGSLSMTVSQEMKALLANNSRNENQSKALQSTTECFSLILFQVDLH